MKTLPALTPADLDWLGRMLEEDLSGLIGYDELRVVPVEGSTDPDIARAGMTGSPVWDMDHKSALLPLSLEGRVAAVARLTGVLNLDRIRVTHTPYLVRLVSLSARSFQLTRSLVIDPVTGLFRRRKLLEEMGRLMVDDARRLTETAPRMEVTDSGPTRPGVALVVVRVLETDRLIREHGRLLLAEIQKNIAVSLAGEGGGRVCQARLDEAVFAWLEPGRSAALARERTQRWAEGLGPVEHEGFGSVSLRLAGGVAAFPEDLPAGWSGDVASAADELTRELEDLAGRALAQSVRRGGGVLSLGDVRRGCGRVTELLPLGRVVIDLGRTVGLEEGMRFYVAHHSEAVSDVYKAELALLSVNAESSTAEITALEDADFPVRVGDHVTLAEERGSLKVRSADEKVIELDGSEIKVLIDQSTGLPNSRSLPGLADALAADGRRLGLLMVRLDGLVSRRAMIGQQEADRLLIRAAEIAARQLPEAISARAGADSVALLLPGADGEAVLTAGRALRDRLIEDLEQQVSVGAADHPFHDAPAARILDRARKALDHASFPQAEPVILFDSVSLNVSGDRLYQRGDVEGAVAEYEHALALDSDNVNVLNSLGVCYGQLGRLEEAAESFGRASGLAPDDYMTWYNLGLVQRELGRTEKALESLTRAHGLGNGDFAVLFALGRMSADGGRYAAAAEWFDKAAGADDAKPVVHRWLGEALARTDRTEEALSRFKQAVKADPRDAAALSWLGRLYQERDRDQEVALSFLDRAVGIEPDNQLFRERLAQALLSNNRPLEAEEQFRSALELGPRNPVLIRGLGLSLAGLGRLEEACRALAEVVDMVPDDDQARQDLERVTELAQETESAG